MRPSEASSNWRGQKPLTAPRGQQLLQFFEFPDMSPTHDDSYDQQEPKGLSTYFGNAQKLVPFSKKAISNAFYKLKGNMSLINGDSDSHNFLTKASKTYSDLKELLQNAKNADESSNQNYQDFTSQQNQQVQLNTSTLYAQNEYFPDARNSHTSPRYTQPPPLPEGNIHPNLRQLSQTPPHPFYQHVPNQQFPPNLCCNRSSPIKMDNSRDRFIRDFLSSNYRDINEESFDSYDSDCYPIDTVLPSNETNDRPIDEELSPNNQEEYLGERKNLIRFSNKVLVMNAADYDRSNGKPWTNMTLDERIAIRQELNDFKYNEMIVHPESRQFTRFHKI